jgi:origin recognition complex subunit 5
MTTKDSAKLYKRFQPILIELIDQIPLKVVNKSEENVVLPDCVKYLLIAAYLSSYNSMKTDKKFFVKYEGKKKDRKRRVTTEEKECNGPKGFSFERMLHIYKSILHLNARNSDDEHLITDASNKFLSQIEELVSLKLLHKIHSNNKNNCISSLAKFQISNSVTLEFIKELSHNLNFNINGFLE